MNRSLALVLALLLPAAASAAVVRPAPDFAFAGAAGKRSTLKSLRGQPVVVIIAVSPRSGAFRGQVKAIEREYRALASRKTLFFAAFTRPPAEPRVKSDIPFGLVADPAALAAAYEMPGKGFRIAVVGRDGNLDAVSSQVRPGRWVRDVIDNSYEAQAASRR